MYRAQCVSYTSDVSFSGGSPGSVLSTILVADNVGPAVGPVEVRDMSLRHSRIGALLVREGGWTHRWSR